VRISLVRVLILGVVALLLAGCKGDRDKPAPGHFGPGVSETEIRLGSSLALSGHASYLGTQTLRGALSYLKYINDEGGVWGRQINLVSYDDSYDPPRCLANTQKLIIEDDVFALFCYVGTPTTVKVLPLVDDARIPLLGMFTGANALREPFNRYVVNIRASYYQETAAAVRHMVKDLGLRRIAVFYQYDAYGFDGLTGTELALKEFGLEPVARGSYVRGTADIEEGLSRIETSGAEAVVLIGTYEPCAKFIHSASENGFAPMYYTVSFVGAEELARRLDEAQGVAQPPVLVMSQVVPPSEPVLYERQKGASVQPSAQMQGISAEYVKLLAKYYPEEKPNSVGLEGFINARILVEGLKLAGRDLTREGFITALESIHDFTLAPGTVVTFGSENHQGMERVYFTRFVEGRFQSLSDWSEVRKIMSGRHSTNQEATGQGTARGGSGRGGGGL